MRKRKSIRARWGLQQPVREGWSAMHCERYAQRVLCGVRCAMHGVREATRSRTPATSKRLADPRTFGV
eukprot:5849270-Alexandrium_andersonii.AAC.1